MDEEKKKALGIPPSAATKSMRITSINELKQIMTAATKSMRITSINELKQIMT